MVSRIFLSWIRPDLQYERPRAFSEQGLVWWTRAPAGGVGAESRGGGRSLHPVVDYAPDPVAAWTSGEASPARRARGHAGFRGAHESPDAAQHEIWGLFASKR